MEQNSDYPGKPWQPLFDYMMKEHGTILTLDAMEELVSVVEKMIGHAAIQAKCNKYEANLTSIKTITNLYKNWDEDSIKQSAFTIRHLIKDVLNLANKALSAGGGEKETMFTSDQVQAMLIEFALAYHKSPNKDIANDAAEYVYDKINQKEDQQ
jgi:hypothetical protein